MVKTSPEHEKIVEKEEETKNAFWSGFFTRYSFLILDKSNSESVLMLLSWKVKNHNFLNIISIFPIE